MNAKPKHPVVLITGASSGIGKALAHEFARDGWHVLLAARRIDALEALADELRQAYGVSANAIASDLEKPDGAARLHADVGKLGLELDALVNNAGYGLYGQFKETQLSSELAMMQLNMSSLIALTKLFLPDLTTRRGRILNVASTASFQPGPYMAVYYATKAFVLSFSEAIAEELRNTVTVTALCPGPTTSGFQDRSAMNKSRLVMNRRLPTSEDVAAAGYRAFKRGRRVYIHGWLNWLMTQSVRVTPRRVVAMIVRLISRPAS